MSTLECYFLLQRYYFYLKAPNKIATFLLEEEKGFEPLNRYKRLVVFKTTALSQLCHSSLLHPLIMWVLFCCYPTTAERVRLTIRSSEYATESCPLKGSILHLPWICKPHSAKVQQIPIFCKYFGVFLRLSLLYSYCVF